LEKKIIEFEGLVSSKSSSQYLSSSIININNCLSIDGIVLMSNKEIKQDHPVLMIKFGNMMKKLNYPNYYEDFKAVWEFE